MQITMDEIEIKEAVANHVRSIITIPEGHDIGMDFTAGRGENGLSVALKITAPVDTPVATRSPTPVEKPKPAKATLVKPVEEAPEEADDEVETISTEAGDTAAEPVEVEEAQDDAPAAEEATKPRSIFSKKTA